MRKPKPKKRGRKPGVKVRPYKKRLPKGFTKAPHISRKIKINLDILNNPDGTPKYSPAPVLTLCGQLEDSVMLLENRISNVIAKINSLM